MGPYIRIPFSKCVQGETSFPLIGRPFWPSPPPFKKEMKCANAVYCVQEYTVLFMCNLGRTFNSTTTCLTRF